MQEADDKGLIRRCLEGDPQAFESIVDRYQKKVYNLVLRIVNDADDAADVTQTAFLRAYEKLASYNERFKFFSWLYKIAVNASLNFLEQKKRVDLLGDRDIPQDSTVEGSLESSERIAMLEAAILKLRPEYRVVIVLRHLHDLSYEEMAQVLGIPEKTVKSRLFTARLMLKDLLQRAGLRE